MIPHSSHVEGSITGATGQGSRRKKRDHGAGIQGTTGTWGSGQRRQDSECRTGGGGRRDVSLFSQAVQDRNKGEKSGVKGGEAQSQGGVWEGE